MRREWADMAFVLPAGGEPFHDDRVAVLQCYGRVVIATVVDDDVENVRAIAGGGLIEAGLRGDVDAATWSSLDPAERLALEGHWLRHSEEYQQAKDARPGQGVAWDHPDFTPPDPPGGVDLTAVAKMNDRLRGKVAIGLLMVSGPGDLAFTEQQRKRVLSEIQSGLSWLGAQWQGQVVRFDIDVYTPQITAKADPTAPDLESLWRDPAMQAIGQGKGREGVHNYATSLQEKYKTDGAYVAFFIHYPAKHFAYAAPDWPETVMQYSNGPWTPLGIDRVFAHESGHIFGAPDEYAGSPCQCGGSHGYYHMPNGNCDKCPGIKQLCIMGNNYFDTCTWTPRHLGAPLWWVNGQDRTVDPVAVSGGVIYYRGTDEYLYRVKTDGKKAEKVARNQTLSTPFVVGDKIYYQGTNYYLYWSSTDGAKGEAIGANKLLSSPFVADGYIYYQGTNNKLYRVPVDGTEGEVIGGNKLVSSPFVSGGYIYYQGTDYCLYRVRVGETDGTRVGDAESLSSPFVSDGVVYFQGTDNALNKIAVDGTVTKRIGECRTLSTPYVVGGFVYHQGTDRRLYRVRTDGSDLEMLTDAPVRSGPIVADDVVYFQGNDPFSMHRLYMFNLT
ncbi:hypothetical protein ABIA31_003742 [Catenulispora sp. MAP5-51]|uniref:DUF5050 domain-containing protein n=1 Tax=Catenulispora sp. MAP5-51 TaxID=3156298 RepID=UPI00351581B6